MNMTVTSAVSIHNTERLLFFVLLQLVIIILAARVVGKLAGQLGQPRAVGEIVAGLTCQLHKLSVPKRLHSMKRGIFKKNWDVA